VRLAPLLAKDCDDCEVVLGFGDEID